MLNHTLLWVRSTPLLNQWLAKIPASTAVSLTALLLVSVSLTGCNNMLKPSEQDTTLAGFPRWVQGVFQLPLGSADAFAAVKLDTVGTDNTTTAVVTPPIPGVAILSQLARYAQQPNSPVEPYAYWLLLHNFQQPNTTNRIQTPSTLLAGKGVWLLNLRGADVQSQLTTLGFMPKTTQERSIKSVWYQPQHQLWLTIYPNQGSKVLLLASSETGLTENVLALQHLKQSQVTLKPEAKTKLIHGLETLFGSNKVAASAEAKQSDILVGLPSNSHQWERLGLKQTLQKIRLPWQNKQQPINPLNNSWTLLTGTDTSNTAKRHQHSMQFVTPVIVTPTDKQYANTQWLEFIFGVPKTQTLTVKTPVAISMSHLNEAAIAAIEADAFPQLNQQLSMVKPALSLLQLDFNRDVLGLLANETWVATPAPKESWILLQKTPTKQASLNKWIGHLSGKSWLSKILFDGKLQKNPVLEQKPLADGSGHFWAIHIPKQAKNLGKLPPLGLIETNNAFVIAPLNRLNQRGVLANMNSLITQHPTTPLEFEPLLRLQADTTQPNGTWLVKQLTQKLTGLMNKTTTNNTTIPITAPTNTTPELAAGIVTVDAGYQPTRGSVRGHISLDLTEK